MNFLNQFNIKFKDPNLLDQALTHSSYSNEHQCKNYERLEFLGDAVLELATSDYFYRMTTYKEGEMSKIRASFVCEKALATYARNLKMNEYIRVGHGQEQNINDTIIADVFEAVVGAIYLDQGYEAAKKYIDAILIPYINSGTYFLEDYKSALQEMVQTDKKSLEYILISDKGPAHNKEFEMEVRIDGMVYGTGIGKSKKEAEQNAALNAIKKSAGRKL
ncbi:MAG: ribonuclease III [Bacilli bacterium]|jgi:ribonuclease-3|nr:ribonuclease III [Bacilli bacterium]